MAERRAHVVGAGLAGLAAAVALAAAGRRVVLHEAQAQAGGRCRSFADPRLGCVVDNGNHLVLSGNGALRAYLAEIGAPGGLVAEPRARYAFADLATGARWTVAPNAGPLPWWVLARGRTVPGVRAAEWLDLARLLRAGPQATVAQAVRGRGALWARFWEPLTLAVLNAPPERAAAALLATVLRETFLKGEAAARPMLAPGGLGAALVEPALGWLAARGAEVRLGHPLRALVAGGGLVTGLAFPDGTASLGPRDAVILALPPSRLAPLMPGLALPQDACAIVNAHFRLRAQDAPRLAAAPPLLGVLGGLAQWIFRRGAVVSVTVSAADALGADRLPDDALLPRLWAECREALGLPPETGYAAGRVNRERRATFDQSPEGVALRPAARTALANLWLAGDATDTGLPATLEGAVRSGRRAAALALEREGQAA